MTTEKTTLKIALSESRPVKIVKADWPIIASAEWFSGQHRSQSSEVAYIRVRQHADGRCIVYASRDLACGASGASGRAGSAAGGFLLEAGLASLAPAELVRAIRRCAGIIGHDELGDECIAALPAEDLV